MSAAEQLTVEEQLTAAVRELAQLKRVIETYRRRIPAEVDAILSGIELAPKHKAVKCKVCGQERPLDGWCKPSDPEWDHPFDPEVKP